MKPDISPPGNQRSFGFFKLILIFLSFFVTTAYQHEDTGVFPGKMCSERRKNHGCGQKKPKSTSSAIFGVENAAKRCELKRCADRVRTEFEQNRRGKFKLFAWTLSPNFFSPKLNFSPSTKKTTEYSFKLFFSINKFLFDFCCLCLFCYNAGQHAISRQKHTGFSTGLYPVYEVYPCGRTDNRTYGR